MHCLVRPWLFPGVPQSSQEIAPAPLDWTAVGALATFLAALATFIASWVTYKIAKANEASAKAARDSLGQIKLQRVDAVKPVVAVLRPTILAFDKRPERVTITIENIGHGPALNCECHASCSGENYQRKGGSGIVLAPKGQATVDFYIDRTAVSRLAQSGVVKISVHSRDLFGHAYELNVSVAYTDGAPGAVLHESVRRVQSGKAEDVG